MKLRKLLVVFKIYNKKAESLDVEVSKSKIGLHIVLTIQPDTNIPGCT